VNKKIITPEFLVYVLTDKKEYIQKIATGATIKEVRPTKLKEVLTFSLPSLKEQKRIVKILDKVFKKIAKTEENVKKNLQNAKEVFESYLQNVFTNPGKDWEEKRLGEVLKLEYGKPLPKSYRKNDGLYPVYGANGIKDFSDKFYFSKPSIVVGRKGSAGELHLVEKNFWPLDVSYYVTFDNKKYNINFLYHLLINLELPKLAKGVKPGINRNEVYSIDVNIPPFPEQKSIVKKLDALSAETKKLEGIYRQKLADLEELKKSVLKKAFEGEL
ncbi:MAG: restriction endonuclease subunit S, partial [Candidatus Portnoybacteria bacterium]|nr:restriction endonuclease subunit S [Candidatus Portnoybacteria bacterium]